MGITKKFLPLVDRSGSSKGETGSEACMREQEPYFPQ